MYARAVLCLWITLIAMIAFAVSSPVPEPIDPNLASIIGSNLNLGCQHGCPGASSAQQLSTNAALSPTISPLSVFGGLVLVSGLLTAI